MVAPQSWQCAAEEVDAVRFSPTTATILVEHDGGRNIEIWTSSGEQPIQHFAAVGHTAALTGVIFSPDGKTVLTGSGDTTSILWDV